MEEPLLFVVDAAFQISNRGCVLVPGLAGEPGGPVVRVGSQVRLVLPDGQAIETHIRGIEMLNYGLRRPEKLTVPILLAPNVPKEQVPVGTKVFLRTANSANANGA